MVGRNSDRVPRFQSLTTRIPGYILVGICDGLGYNAALPLAALLRRYGKLFPVEFALVKVRCGDCGENPA